MITSIRAAAAPPTSMRQRICGAVEASILAVVAPVSAALVLAMALLLFGGVLARYVFSQPLSWSDELASIMFLWLAMLGSVLALARQEHMRLSTVVGLLPRPAAALLEAVSALVVCGFLLMMIGPAIGYAESEWIVVTPALEWPDGLRVLGVAVGIGLMLVISVARLLALADVRHLVIAAVIVACLVALLVMGRPLIVAAGKYNLILFFVVIVAAAVVSGVPIAFAFGAGTVAYLATATRIPIEVMVGRMDEGVSQMILLSIPMFVLLGLFMEMTGLARALITAMASLVGHVRGGLFYVLIGAMYLVSGISGSKAADMAAVAPMLLPEMERRGAKRHELVALLAATGAQTETIPPSFVLIILGSVTGLSIASLFTAGLLPALVAGVALCVVCFLKTRNEPLQQAERPGARRLAQVFLYSLPALALPFVIRAAVVEGITTATEVSTVGLVYCTAAGLLVYRQFDWRRLYPMLVSTASLSGAILLILATATGMAWALTRSGFSRDLAAVMTALPGGAGGFMAISVILFVLLGSLLEGVPAIILFGPLLFPIARGLGINEIHYAIVAVLAMGVGLFTPPFGVGFYAACAIGRASPDAVIGSVWPYIAAVFAALVVVAAVPWLSTCFL